MAAAVLVRLPSAYLWGASDAERKAQTSDEGLPYLTELDSYYHVRLTDDQLDHGSLGDTVLEDGTPWDMHSFYPDGRSADYQPGIVHLTTFVYKILHALFGTSLYAVQFCLSAFMSALAALAAFLAGLRLSNRAGGVVSGILVACASGFVSRTTFGRYDTDMFVVLLDILLFLCLTEAFKARRLSGQLLASAGFGLSVLLYILCWTPKNAMLFVTLVLLGGFFYVLSLLFAPKRKNDPNRVVRLLKSAELRTFLICCALTVLVILVVQGPAFFREILEAAQGTTDVTAAGELPNVFVSVSELQVPQLFPETFVQWFAGFVPGGSMSIVNGVGGAAVLALSLASLVVLVFSCFPRFYRQQEHIQRRRHNALYVCVLGLLLAGGIYGTSRGVRFMEHLSVPVGILAGGLIGRLSSHLKDEDKRKQYGKIVLIAVLCIASVVPALSGSLRISATVRPSVSDASAKAMKWVRENAASSDAVIASWWDDGYFYESESGHPCLWDGGSSQDGIRAILVSRALTTDDEMLSAGILTMLSSSGNHIPEQLMEHMDTASSFALLFEALALDREEAEELLAEAPGSPVLPDKQPEIYFVLTSKMMQQYGWYEYFGDWNFSGENVLPGQGDSRLTPGGDTADADAESPEERRAQSVFWRLFADGEEMDSFEKVFEAQDALARVCVFRVVY